MARGRTGDTRKPSPTLAHRMWLEADGPSFRELKVLLAARGYSVDESTLSRWKDRNPTWAAQFCEKYSPVDPTKMASALQEVKDDAAELSPQHYLGMKARLLFRLYQGIRSLNISTVDELSKGLECCDRIEALIHAERGNAVSAMEIASQETGERPSLIARLHPQIKLAPFKNSPDTP
jgi:hypothetical protein